MRDQGGSFRSSAVPASAAARSASSRARPRRRRPAPSSSAPGATSRPSGRRRRRSRWSAARRAGRPPRRWRPPRSPSGCAGSARRRAARRPGSAATRSPTTRRSALPPALAVRGGHPLAGVRDRVVEQRPVGRRELVRLVLEVGRRERVSSARLSSASPSSQVRYWRCRRACGARNSGRGRGGRRPSPRSTVAELRVEQTQQVDGRRPPCRCAGSRSPASGAGRPVAATRWSAARSGAGSGADVVSSAATQLCASSTMTRSGQCADEVVAVPGRP